MRGRDLEDGITRHVHYRHLVTLHIGIKVLESSRPLYGMLSQHKGMAVGGGTEVLHPQHYTLAHPPLFTLSIIILVVVVVIINITFRLHILEDPIVFPLHQR